MSLRATILLTGQTLDGFAAKDESQKTRAAITAPTSVAATLAGAVRQEKAVGDIRTGKEKVTLNLVTVFFDMTTWKTQKTPRKSTTLIRRKLASH